MNNLNIFLKVEDVKGGIKQEHYLEALYRTYKDVKL